MNSRALQILNLARQGAFRKHETVFQTDNAPEQHKTTNDQCEKPSDLASEDTLNPEPVINKTRSTADEADYDNLEIQIEESGGYTNTEYLYNFSSDDSVRDPNFEVSDMDVSSSDEEGIRTRKERMKNLDGSSANNPVEKPFEYDSSKVIAMKRNRGESYTRKTGVVKARKCRPLKSCKKNCKEKISYSNQQKIFKSYWNLGTFNQRILFIGSLIEIEDKKTQTLKKSETNPRNRQHHIQYFLTVEKEKIRVCQKCFKQCFNETDSFLKSVAKKKLEQPHISFKDNRGSGGGSNKMSAELVESIKAHINSFPAYESHYSRRDTSCKYFHADLTLTVMYNLFRERNPTLSVSLSKFSQIFKGMNIKFKKPCVDTCNKCDTLKIKIEAAKRDGAQDLEKLQSELNQHHAMTDLAYESKKEDKMLAKRNPEMKVYAFDLQQCLPTPFLRNSVSFYKRQLWTYNLTIHDFSTNVPYCFMWHEAIAKRGGNEIASCLLNHIKSVSADTQIRHLIFYSDSCGGQNKNSFVSTMFLTFFQASSNIETIEHKFLEPGHTHMECDVDHALIEKKKKRTEVRIHHPHDWYNFVRTVGIKNPFKVIEMTSQDFYDFGSTSKTKLLWRCRDENSNKFVWNKVRWLRYNKNNFGKIEYKTTLDKNQPFSTMNVSKRGVNSLKLSDIPKAPTKNLISSKKKADLESLLQFIDPSFHDFYRNLETDSQQVPDIHPDLLDEEENEEI